MREPRAVLFDMDGVVVDSMRCHADSWKEVLAEYGVILDDIDIFKREGMSGKNSVEDIFNEKGIPIPCDDDFEKLLIRKHYLFENKPVKIYPNIQEIIDFIKSRNIPIALVTGSLFRSVQHVLAEALMSNFDSIVTAEDVEKGKPYPEPYLMAIGQLGVKPEVSLVVENAPMGILSAKRAGTTCYAIATTLPVHYLQDADVVFTDHISLLEYFKNLMKR